VGGILIIFTSYVSSFPEFMMTYRYAVADKKSALLGMLFGSNVIDLAFAGFRAIRLGEPMEVYTTGSFQVSFPFYLWCLPALALLALLALAKRWFKYWHAYPLVVFYIIYIVSGAILL
jgi:Ca2+/Na+ antiporter